MKQHPQALELSSKALLLSVLPKPQHLHWIPKNTRLQQKTTQDTQRNMHTFMLTNIKYFLAFTNKVVIHCVF